MAVTSNNIINPNDIIRGFTEAVVNTILEDAYDINNPPMDGTNYCIEQDRLGDKNSIVIPDVGIRGAKVNASSIYNTLVAITTTLTRVGTFSYIRRYRTTTLIASTTVEGQYTTQETNNIVYQTSGTAFFTESYIRSLASVSNSNVVSNAIISATGIQALFNNLASAWERTNRHNNVIDLQDCHSDCNCYTGRCYSSTNCYK